MQMDIDGYFKMLRQVENSLFNLCLVNRDPCIVSYCFLSCCFNRQKCVLC